MKKKQAENSSRVGASVVSVMMLVSKIADTPTRTVMVPFCPRCSVWGKHSARKSTPAIGAASSQIIGQKPGGNAAPTSKLQKNYYAKGVFHWAEHKQKHLRFG